MAFPEYFIKVGDYVIPWRYIQAETYKVTPDQRQDMNSYRNAKGKLIRTVLPNKPTSISFTTPDNMSYADKCTLMNNIQANWTVAAERKCTVTYYDDMSDSMLTADMYMPDISFEYKTVDVAKSNIVYKAFTLEFIGY